MKNQKYKWRCLNGHLGHSFEEIGFVEPPVYEVIRLIDGKPLFFKEHFKRLKASLAILDYDYELTQETLLREIRLLVDHQGINNENIRIEIGRKASGTFDRIVFIINSAYPDKALYNRGVKTATFEMMRQSPHAKVSRQSYVDAVNQAKKEQEAYEILLVNASGQMSEGSRSNLFFIKEHQLISAKSDAILLGVTRQKILECAKNLPIDYVEQTIKLSEIGQYDAAFLSGTSINILPIAQIDDHHYDFSHNELLQSLMKAFNESIKDNLNTIK